MGRNYKGTILTVFAALILLLVFACISHLRLVSKPLAEGPGSKASVSTFSEFDKQAFLTEDFQIVTDVKKLPGSVLQEFTEHGSSRLLIANPNESFLVGDVILDPNLPRKRLIFAGVGDRKYFVHYEQGGRGHSYVVELFGMASDEEMKPLWKGYCRAPATSVQDLLQCVSGGK